MLAAVSVGSGGFLICSTPAFEVISSVPAPSPTGPCLVTSGVAGESCLYDRNYGNNERCTAKVTLDEVMIDTVVFDTESGFDYLTINGQQFSGTCSSCVHVQCRTVSSVSIVHAVYSSSRMHSAISCALTRSFSQKSCTVASTYVALACNVCEFCGS